MQCEICARDGCRWRTPRTPPPPIANHHWSACRRQTQPWRRRALSRLANLKMITQPERSIYQCPESELRRFSDIEERATHNPHHKHMYDQLVPGRFVGCVECYIVSDSSAFFVEETNVSIRKRFHILPGHLRFGGGTEFLPIGALRNRPVLGIGRRSIKEMIQSSADSAPDRTETSTVMSSSCVALRPFGSKKLYLRLSDPGKTAGSYSDHQWQHSESSIVSRYRQAQCSGLFAPKHGKEP